MLLAVFWVGGLALLVVLSILVAGGVLEFYKMQVHKGLQPWSIPGVVASVIWCIAVYYFGVSELAVPLAVLLVAIIATGAAREGSTLANVESTLMGVLYVAVLGSFAIQVRAGSFPDYTPGETAAFAVLILLAIWISDIFGYFAGRAFGRHHPFPDISPGKTVAGYIGGVVGSVALILAVAEIYAFLDRTDGIVLGILVGLGAPAGDLVESMIKRDAGVKDASQIIPGHGGILDRFDSFLFVFPIVYVYISFVQTV
jgi:phosphatidate cytidylyltransferase